LLDQAVDDATEKVNSDKVAVASSA